jgi:hypothetical protein
MLWDAENARNFDDEINLVEPGLVADGRACRASGKVTEILQQQFCLFLKVV